MLPNFVKQLAIVRTHSHPGDFAATLIFILKLIFKNSCNNVFGHLFTLQAPV